MRRSRERGSDGRKMKSEVKMREEEEEAKKGREEMSGSWKEGKEQRKRRGRKRGRKEDAGIGAKWTFNHALLFQALNYIK